MSEGYERMKARRAARDASGVAYVDGSIYENMAACVVRSGVTLAQVHDYNAAAEIAAALNASPSQRLDAATVEPEDAWQTFTLRWIGAPRPPIHPEPMQGRQTFDSFERAMRFMVNQPSDATFVSLHAHMVRRFDRSDDARAALAADARLHAALATEPHQHGGKA